MSCYAMRRIGQIIQQQGATVTYQHATKTGSAANPTITLVPYTAKAIVAAYENSVIDGTLVKIGDLRVIMATRATDGTTLPAPVQTDDKLTIDGKTRVIGVVKPLYAGPTVAVWDIQAKG